MNKLKFISKKFKLLLFNPVYSRGSLYGMGIFPFWLYVKYFGKPVYKKARKLGLNKYFSLMAANILGSLAHVNFFINQKITSIFWFALSLVIFAGLFYLGNNLKSRR